MSEVKEEQYDKRQKCKKALVLLCEKPEFQWDKDVSQIETVFSSFEGCSNSPLPSPFGKGT